MNNYKLKKKKNNYIIKDIKGFITTIRNLKIKGIKKVISLGILYIVPLYTFFMNELPTHPDIQMVEEIIENYDTQTLTENIMNQSDVLTKENSRQPMYQSLDNLTSESEILDEKDKLKEYFEFYCDIYQLNPDLVYQKAQELTNNFTNFEWIENNNIKGTMVVKKERTYASQELGILAFVRHIKQLPGDFGYTEEELYANQPYKMNLTFEEFTKYVCSLLDYLNPNICQAIQYHETNHYTSSNFKTKNNCGGLKNADGTYQTFDNPAQSIIEIAFQLEYKYLEDKGISNNATAEEQIAKIQVSYCPIPTLPEGESLTEESLQIYEQQKALNEAWLESVTNLFYQVSSNQVEEDVRQKK